MVNANPHTPALSIKKNGTSLKNGLAYPIESKMLKLKPGSYMLNAFYGKIPIAEKMITPEAGYIYTAIIGADVNTPGDLAIRVLKNPSRALLNKQ